MERDRGRWGRGGGNGRRVGGEGSDGTTVLGEKDEGGGGEARYHAKQHEKRRKTKLAKLREFPKKKPGLTEKK